MNESLSTKGCDDDSGVKDDPVQGPAVKDNVARSRFELDVGGSTAFASYRRAAGNVIITHTETPAALRGRGVASRLVEGAIGLIRAEGAQLVAGCSFVADYLEKHPKS